jgi:hypothetical protein
MSIEWTWWCLTLLPLAWFLQLTIHELSHLVVGKLDEGLKPTGFHPYPHMHNGKLYFARWSFKIPSGVEYEYGRKHKPRHIAPFFGGLLVVGLALLAFLFLSPAGRPWTLPFMVCGLGDALWFWRGYFWGSSKCDGKRWRHGEVL